jgi:hypothetical protein
MQRKTVLFARVGFGRGILALIACVAVAAPGCAERPMKPAGSRPGTAAAPSAMAEAKSPSAPAVDDKNQFKPVEDVAALMALPTVGTCAIDGVIDVAAKQPVQGPDDKTFPVLQSGSYRLTGFATDSEAGTIPADIRILLRSKSASYVLAGSTGVDRPGVVKFFDKPSLLKSGYVIEAGFAGVKPDRYDVFVVKDSDGTVSPTHKAIVVE